MKKVPRFLYHREALMFLFNVYVQCGCRHGSHTMNKEIGTTFHIMTFLTESGDLEEQQKIFRLKSKQISNLNNN